ncbi:MAG: nitrate ABC transporter substrate-binding protein [Ilumatobacteraceae bacterium]
MTVTSDRPRIVTLAASSIFQVPDRVAEQHGLFEKHGLDVQASWEWKAPDQFVPDSAEHDPLGQFTSGQFDTWNMCEWGSVYRVEKADGRAGRIAYLRPAVVAQAIVSFDPDLQEPHDLSGVPVVTGLTTGGHYTTLQILEGALRRDQIVVEGSGPGGGMMRIDELKAGQLRAITTMEPFISLALKEGAHVIASSFYRGAQVFAESVPVEAQQAYVRAVNEAADLLNADLDSYRHLITEWAGDRLAPDELRQEYFRFTHAKEYSQQRFDESYAWMASWGLAVGDKSYEQIINASVLG